MHDNLSGRAAELAHLTDLIRTRLSLADAAIPLLDEQLHALAEMGIDNLQLEGPRIYSRTAGWSPTFDDEQIIFAAALTMPGGLGCTVWSGNDYTTRYGDSHHEPPVLRDRFVVYDKLPPIVRAMIPGDGRIYVGNRDGDTFVIAQRAAAGPGPRRGATPDASPLREREHAPLVGHDHVAPAVGVEVGHRDLRAHPAVVVDLLGHVAGAARAVADQPEPVEDGWSIGVDITTHAVRPAALARHDVLQPIAVDVRQGQRVELAERHGVIILLRRYPHDPMLGEGTVGPLLKPSQTAAMGVVARHHVVAAVAV